MKLWKLSLVLLAAAFVTAGCADDDPVIFDPVPAPPQGVTSITADGEIYLYFTGLYEKDINYYVVYRSLQEFDGYQEVGTVDAEPNPDGLTLYYYEFVDDAVVNGVTYWYAVSAVDHAGQESHLSAESLWDTPRPEGFTSVFYYNDSPEYAGFDLAAHQIIHADSVNADIWLDYFVTGNDTSRYINVGNIDTDIMDMGYTADFDEITLAPDAPFSGWSQVGYCELLPGHTYVVWTADNHFAKIRVERLDAAGYARLQWGYQIDEGNIQLSPRPPHDENYLNEAGKMLLLR